MEAPPLPPEALALQRRAGRLMQRAQLRRILRARPDDARPIIDGKLPHALDLQVESGRLNPRQCALISARHRLRHIPDEVQRQVESLAPGPAPGRQVVLAQAEELVFDAVWQVDGDE